MDANEIRSVSREMFTGLTSLKHLSMQSNPIGSLPADLFSGMSSLEILSLYGLTLTELPEGIFSGLRSIKSLGIGGIQLSRVPAGLFSGLTTLESLTMHRMGLTSLPDGVFSGLTALESLWLVDNNLSSLPQDVFSGLTSLDRLGLAGNNLASLPANLFSGLTALEDILLSENQLRSLPPGIFVGLSSIAELELQGNAVFPLPVSVTLEKVGTSQFKAVAPTAAPFALEIGIGVSASGEIAGGANTVTIPAGSVESAPLAVNRVAGTEDPVTVDIRGLPNPPGDHRGYALEKDGALPLELAPRAGPETDATLSALVLSDGTLSPSFVKGVTSYTATVGNAVSSITVTPTKSKDNARVAFLDANDNALADADTSTDSQQVDLSVGENTLKVKVTAEDNATTLTYTIVVTRNSVPEITTTSPLIVEENRTAVATLQATDADGDEITWTSQGGADADRFDLTTAGELAFATAPDFESPSDADANNEYVIVVRASDGTETVDLALTVQVTDVDDSPSDDAGLSGLSLSVGTLDPAFDTATASYTATVANGVSSITVTPTKSDANATLAYRDANDAELDDADGNTPGRQAALRVGENTIKVRVTAEDATATRTYTIVVTRLVATDVCERTEQVRDAIVAGISGVNDCKDVTNAQLSGITGLDISGESITSLQSGDFDGLAGLKVLELNGNLLTELPDGLFLGLNSLNDLDLSGNRVDPLPLPVTLEKVGGSEFQAVAPTGAPFGLVLPVSASSAGEIAGGANTVTIAAGRAASAAVSVTRVSGAKAAVTVDFGTLPAPPAGHAGYSLSKDADLPLEVLPVVVSDDARLTALSLSSGALDPAFASETTSYTAKVANSVSSITVTPTRSDADAPVTYLDAGDTELADANSSAEGRQIDLSPGENTIKVKVTAEDNTATRTYTLVVTRNRLPVIATSSPVSLEENQTAVVLLAATDGDNDGITWSTNGGADESLFNLTSTGDLAFVSAPDYESPSDADTNNEYVVVVQAADGADTVDLTLIVKVTDADEVASDDASLSGLTLSSGTLDPAFASGTTSYTATVGNAVSSITVMPTKSNRNAAVEYLDVRDDALSDAESGTEGQQASLRVGRNTIKVKVTAEDMTTTEIYTVVVTRGGATGVCARTEQVRDAIVARVSGVDACENVTAAHLSGIASLSIAGHNMQSLQTGDFAGLTGLTFLSLSFNDLAGLPSDIFSGLTALESLDLVDNEISNLPASVFSGLSALEVLLLGDNDLGQLPAGVFSGLSALEELELDSCGIRSLPADVFSGLGSLQSLVLSYNELSSLPTGIFSGLTALSELKLNGNTANPLPVSVSLEKVGESQFRAVAPTGAPFSLDLPVSAAGDGLIQGGADSVTVSTGAVESSALTVTRRSGTTGAVTADIGTLPSLPANHSGYVLQKDNSLPLEVLPAPPGSDATLSGLTLSDGTLDPVFDSGTTNYTVTVGNTVSSITVTPAKSDGDAKVDYLDVRDDTLDDAESGTEGQQVSLSIGRNTIRVKVTAQDTTTTQTYTVVVTRGSATGVCARTEQVRDEIVDTVSGVDACEDVTEAHLAGITQLDLISNNISSLRSGDFAGLTGLEILYIFNNKLKSLPAGIFSGLTELAVIEMSINELGSLDSQVFSGLTNLEVLDLYDNKIASLPSGVFSGLTSLRKLALNNNGLTELSSGIFSGLTALTDLRLRGNKFTGLDANLFSGLTALETLWLDRNQLSSLPAGLFSGLTKIEQLLLSENKLSDLPSGVFSDLDALEWLWLHGNSLTSLPSGIFSGLDGLARLKLESNSVDPLPLTVSLEKVGSSRFKAVAAAGAPFAMALPVTVSSDGEIDGGASSVTIAAGGTESGAVGVTRLSGTTGVVTVNIGTLPGLPANHSGYALAKDDSLPLEVLAEQSGATGEGVAFDASFADVNGNGRLEADDAMIIYHAVESAGGLGDGDEGGTPAARATLLAGLAGAPGPDDDDLRGMLRKANEWREVGVEAGGDINGDGAIDGHDAMIMHYAYAFQDLLGNGESGGAGRFRRSLLAGHAARPDPGDADLKALLRKAQVLRAAASESVQ